MTKTPNEQVGRVIRYAGARLIPRFGSSLTAEEISLDYQRWCARFSYVPLRDGIFRAELQRLAKRIDLRSESNDADTLYRDVAFVSHGP